MTHPLLPGIVGVVVPKGAKYFNIIESHRYFQSPRVEHSIGGVDLPPGNYELVGLGNDLTEEQAAGIVESRYNGYADYESDGYFGMDRYGNYHAFPALVSFSSLLRSLNLDGETTVILRSAPPETKL